ncbi:MOSC domain-containing protein [Halorientalis brevis]|uniref:MOSC domain-containing protein n=1 Tax=Halorientalis brevis TaxID=1126241 RepID=A0ABD6C9I4_9EURY|nr:MOSC N-terminal beta barrel domain-containing protein [Halorientalis brevis]
MRELARITVYPVKSLDGCTLDSATIGAHGALALDREYAIFDADGAYVNGKATARIHRLDAAFDPATHDLTVGERGTDERHTYCLRDETERAALNEWLSDFFDEPVTVERDAEGGYPDDTEIHGPTVISTGTVRAVADWFDLPPENVRRRFRANLELDATEPFWEDRLFADHGEVVPFSIGDVTLLGVNPCQRCVVPSRDPDTGEESEGFRERFVRKREATLPAWTPSDRFDHPYRLMLNTDVPESEWGAELAVGESVTVGERRPADAT